MFAEVITTTFKILFPLVMFTAQPAIPANSIDASIERARIEIAGAEPLLVPGNAALNDRLDVIHETIWALDPSLENKWSDKGRYRDIPGDGMGSFWLYQGRLWVYITNKFSEGGPLYGSRLIDLWLAHEWAGALIGEAPHKQTQAQIFALEVLASMPDKASFWRAWWFMGLSARMTDAMVAGDPTQVRLTGRQWMDDNLLPEERDEFTYMLGDYWHIVGAMDGYYRQPVYAIMAGLDSGQAAGIAIPNIVEALR